ncbi:O-antigen ligase family protein [Micromonospora sp. NBC_00860]|nr:O-antigen ligase family protein [Micromonospora sp. NBC_00860]
MAAWDPFWSLWYVGPAAAVAVLISGRMPRLRLPDLLAITTSAWAFATLLWTSNEEVTRKAAYMYAAACCLFVAARHVIAARPHQRFIGLAFLAGCLATGVRLINENASGRQGAALLDLTLRAGIEGITVNFTAYTLVTGALAAILLIICHGRSLVVKVASLTAMAMFGFGILLGGSRGAAIALTLAIVYLAISRMAPRASWIGVGVCAMAAIVVVAAGTTPQSGTAWLDGLFGRPTGDMSGRLLVWPEALHSWQESLLTGIGAGIFRENSPYNIGAHNLVLNLGNDLGLVGLLLYVGTIATAMVAAARTGATQRRLAGLTVAALLPIWLSGEWQTSQAAWLLLALVSATAWTNPPAAGQHRRPRTQTWRAAVGGSRTVAGPRFAATAAERKFAGESRPSVPVRSGAGR